MVFHFYRIIYIVDNYRLLNIPQIYTNKSVLYGLEV